MAGALALGCLHIPLACDAPRGDGGGTAGTAARGVGGEGGESAIAASARGNAGASTGELPQDDAAAARAAHCRSICGKPVTMQGEAGTGGEPVAMSCGREVSCVAYFCNTIGLDRTCVGHLDAVLACVDATDPSYLYCGPEFVAIDLAGDHACPDELYALLNCLP